jgi:NDP-sugar pyrophosphorylase family protein
MNILVLMAGRGKRFTDEGYTTPKPLLKVNNKTILEWTTESCPYIKHGGMGQDEDIHLYFSVLQEHLNNGLDEFLHSVYGKNITIIPFTKVTRGNLETAHISCKRMLNIGDDLLILDSDNKYNDNNACYNKKNKNSNKFLQSKQLKLVKLDDYLATLPTSDDDDESSTVII